MAWLTRRLSCRSSDVLCRWPTNALDATSTSPWISIGQRSVSPTTSTLQRRALAALMSARRSLPSQLWSRITRPNERSASRRTASMAEQTGMMRAKRSTVRLKTIPAGQSTVTKRIVGSTRVVGTAPPCHLSLCLFQKWCQRAAESIFKTTTPTYQIVRRARAASRRRKLCAMRVACIAIGLIWAAAAGADVLYRLPWPEGLSLMFTQVHGGRITTHFTKATLHAVDIGMPQGTAVLAARAGIVEALQADQGAGEDEGPLTYEGNFVRVRHADRTAATYAHLKHQGVTVVVGDGIEAGQLLGISGASGDVLEPHLHFVVTRVHQNSSGWREEV